MVSPERMHERQVDPVPHELAPLLKGRNAQRASVGSTHLRAQTGLSRG